MKTEFVIDNIINFNLLAKEQAGKYPQKRAIYNKVSSFLEKDRLIGIIGQRGTGKTVILKQLNNDIQNSIYISFDIFNFRGKKVNEIFEILINLTKNFNIKNFFFDEIHYYSEALSLFKMIYDFSDIKVVFSSSMAVGLSKIQIDLSRRIKMIYIYPFDFIEYLKFYHKIDLEYLSFNSIIKEKFNIPISYIGFEEKFKDFLLGNIFPFGLEVTNVIENLKNILYKIIFSDIPQIFNLSVKELDDIMDMISFIGRSEIDGINYSSISKNLEITKYKARQYTDICEKSFILNIVFPKGTNVKKEPKIVLTPPIRLLFKDYIECIGGLREDFAVQMLKQKGFNFYYLKSPKGEKRPDYLIEYKGEKIIIEIGGKGKGYIQFKGIEGKYKKLIFKQNWNFDTSGYPLYLLGMFKA